MNRGRYCHNQVPFELLLLRPRFSLASALALLLCGCGLFASEEEPARRSESAAGILFGQHIEGVTLTDDSSAVREKLGLPDVFVRGAFPSVTYRYHRGPAAGLEVEIATDTLSEIRGGDAVRPGGIINVCAYAPYEGETRSGVGIGTPRAEAHRQLGMPSDTSAPGFDLDRIPDSLRAGWYDEYSLDWYTSGDARFRLEYRADKDVYSVCIEPQAGRGRIVTNLEGTTEQLSVPEQFPQFGVRPDHYYGTRWITEGSHFPKAFRQDSLRVVFTAHWITGSATALGSPIRLISIEKTEQKGPN